MYYPGERKSLYNREDDIFPLAMPRKARISFVFLHLLEVSVYS